MSEPRILLVDIETLPNIVTSWGLHIHDGYLNHKNILQERTMLCAAWKWLGAPNIYDISILDPNERGAAEDARITSKLAEEINLADAVIAHNGDNFDFKWIRTRMVFLGLQPHKPVIQIDTRKIAKDKFNFNSNKLDYLGQYLGCGAKIKTDFDLWLSCLESNDLAKRVEAVKQMVIYNREDVALLERVYLKLRPFVTAKLNMALFAHPDVAERTCSACGQPTLIRNGLHYTRVGTRVSLQCKACGHWDYRLTRKDGEPTGLPR